MRIAVLTPSRARPAQFTAMCSAIRDTADAEVTIYLGTDYDDGSHYPSPPGVKHFAGPRKQLGAWTNELAMWALADGCDILASFGDDHRPRTPGWDTEVVWAFEAMGSGLVYTADGLQNMRLPTAPFWSADVIRALGWYFPPTLAHMYADNYWLHLARALSRCTYLPNVMVEHLHPSCGKAEADAITAENDRYYDADRAAYEAFLVDGHFEALARVREAL